jgi:3-oxoacyl-[acyl-carrier protein] reductase
MGDFLLEKGNQPGWNKVLKSVGAPIPTKLKRLKGGWEKNVLAGKKVAYGSAPGGINPSVFNSVFIELGNTSVTSAVGSGEKANALVYDATGISNVAQLKHMYEFFHKNSIRKLASCARIVIVANSVPKTIDTSSVEAAETQYELCTAQQGVEGFSRSLSKEVGGKGAIVNLIRLTNAKEATDKTLLPYIHFMLSDGPAYVTGQVIEVNVSTAVASAPLEKSLSGKTAIVTGSARGIGEATARKLAAEGATVVVLDRPQDAEAGKAVASSIGGKFLGVDMSSDTAATTIADFIKNELGGGIDIIVHNAGITRDKTIANMDAGLWDMVLNVNLDTIIKTNKELLKQGLIKDGGRIIGLSSISGFAGNFGQTNYAATKAGVIGYVRSISQLTAAKKITVNAVAPGFIETQMTAKMPAMTAFFGRRLSNLNQGGQPTDIGDVITFLASPGSAGVSGQIIRVCGGNYLGA